MLTPTRRETEKESAYLTRFVIFSKLHPEILKIIGWRVLGKQELSESNFSPFFARL